MSPRRPADIDGIAAMLRDGATYREIHAAYGCSRGTISQVRRDHRIPTPDRWKKHRTVAEVLALNSEACEDGHVRWTGPHARGNPELWANGRRYNGRHEAFKAHHGRAPLGRVTASCGRPGCIAGPHLADRVIRDADAVLARILPRATS
ncbi:hypothetical protein [Streptomyces sp. NBC_00582]|uniref:hypothetical protein n=1 Tax=Streptomyces sp. NBC_00582 TaxID=2975783 RepID=UPI002E824076|nr:hypothetical protein [Streptomyces sp. NBC_00582]WUB61515.1 helix-turn-helix domain-containing protein [Streptomyces sp. NBC_00582]